jgi:hypothetical protein
LRSRQLRITQELTKISWNSKVHYPVHKSPPLVPTLSQISPGHTIPSYLSNIRLNIIHLPTSWFSQWSLSCWFSHQYTIYIPSYPRECYMPWPSHPPLRDHSNYTWRRVQVMKLIMQFSPAYRHFVSLWSKYSPQLPVLEHPQSVFLP